MCLIAFRYEKDADYPFIFIENRDEEYKRPSRSLHFWEDEPDILAGRDLKRLGTWLGITRSGRMASLLNHPFTDFQPDPNEEESLSRGSLARSFLARSFLAGKETDEEFLAKLKETRREYDGYHFLFGTPGNLHLYSNVLDQDIQFEEGLHSISNTEGGLSQFKLKRSKQLLKEYLEKNEQPDLDELVSLFFNTETDQSISSVPEEISRELAIEGTAMFITGEEFGSVGTTAIVVDKKGCVKVKEVRYGNHQQIIDETECSFQIKRKEENVYE